MKRIASKLILLLVLCSVLVSLPRVRTVKASGTIYIRANGSVDPDTAPISTVDNVTYIFTSNIGDSIVVERDDIVVDGAGYTLQRMGGETGIDLGGGPGLLPGRSNVTIKNMEIKAFKCGIVLEKSSNNVISGNTIANNEQGIDLYKSSNNSISGNTITNNEYDIWLYASSNYNTISENNITENNERGIWLYASSNNTISGNNITNKHYSGIVLGRSSNNVISGNNITNNYYGIFLEVSSNNSISGNNIINDSIGIDLYKSSNYNSISGNNIIMMRARAQSSNNSIFHNNFIGNTDQADVYQSFNNTWDNGYPSGGNYWDDYGELDTDGDGIGDTPYVIDANNQDRYPLVVPLGPIPIVWDETIYPVEIKSNSTIFRFQFNASQRIISFNVTGTDGTLGFCNLTIPNSLIQDLWQGNFIVLVDGEEPIMMNNWTDGTYTYIYFTYQHSTRKVEIIPEFPAEEISPFWMQWWFWTIVIAGIVVLAGALYFLKKRKPPTPTASLGNVYSMIACARM